MFDYTYLADGKVDHADYRNGVHCAYSYDGRGMTSSIQYTRGDNANLSKRTYWRDERDRITAYQKSAANSINPMENGRGDRFRYDEEGQLVEAWYNATNPANSGAGNTRYDQFNYDALGNRKGSNYVANHGWMTFTRKDNGLNQYHAWGANPANYDDEIPGWGAPGLANGVLNVDGNVAAGYNALNQAIMINTQAMGSNWLLFGYDPLGRCVKRWTGSPDFSAAFPWVTPESNPATYFYYEGWNLIQEGPSSTTASRNYVHGARVDEIVKQIRPTDMWERYFHYDARGHCTLQTDSAGNIVEQYEYDAFGQPYFYDYWGNNIGYSPFGNRFLFTGREYLSDLKLYDYRNRMYQPELGRFMQPDPKEFAAGDYNLYRYCHNDPINKSDPTGTYYVVQHEAGSRDYVVQIPIQYTGPGNTAEARAEYSKGIESLSGAYKGEVNGKSVDINVTFRVTEPKQGELKNTVYVREGFGAKGFGEEWGTAKAVWYAGGGRYQGQDISASDGARHSVGHFLGFKDRYDKATGTTHADGWGHLMDWRPGGTLSVQDVNRVVHPTWWGQRQLEWGNYP